MNNDALLGEAQKDTRHLADPRNNTSVVEFFKAHLDSKKCFNVPYIYDRLILRAWCIGDLAELHTDLLSRHARPLYVRVVVADDERSEDVTSHEICRRYNGKQQKRRRDGRGVQLPDWAMNKIKRKHYCSYLGHLSDCLLYTSPSPRD